MAAVPERDTALARSSRDAGFSLAEIIVALSVFAAIAVAGVSIAIDSLGVTGDNRERVRAANIASAEIEQARAIFRTSRGGLPETTVVSSKLVDGSTFTVQRTATWIDAAGSAGPGGSYTAATGSALRIEVRVSWPDLGDRTPVINSTVLS